MSRLAAHQTTTPSNLNAPKIKNVSSRQEILAILKSGLGTQTKENYQVPMISPIAVAFPTYSTPTLSSVVSIRKLNENEGVLPSLTLEHAPDLNNKARSRICNRLSQEQKEKAKEYMESFGWKEIRNKDAREAAKAFCIENGIGKNQWKYWVEHQRRVRVRKGSSTK
ncbi:hypothetical protein M9H77_27226 [Catharanthus roseus]|uniref:Uncharacterized protein n=1 Tax=Catharanthus roseus TaxID=4058 RepID=A0ACC0AG64_CATRO|nr:hypothetical protein M9H77_27226 [Catharanthus roseus]